MKIRNGFVSNSSSSSFAIIGVKAEGINLKELAKAIAPELAEEDIDAGSESELRDDLRRGDFYNDWVLIEDAWIGKEFLCLQDWEVAGTDLEGVLKYAEEVKEVFEKVGIKDRLKLIIGRRES